jgi:sulfate adenylyltransferase
MEQIIEPYGGVLCDLVASEDVAEDLRQMSLELPSLDLTPRQLCDFELLASGGFSPLRGFMTKSDYQTVVDDMRLADGTLWPMPVTLDVAADVAGLCQPGAAVALRDPEGVLLGILHVDDLWEPDKELEASSVFGTTSLEHPGVRYLMGEAGPLYVGGRVEAAQLPVHYDFRRLRKTPSETRAEFASRGWSQVVAFQTRNPMHRAHVELTRRAASEHQAKLLIHPVVGMTKPGDVDHYTRVRCYEAVLEKYPDQSAALALLPLAMRMGGPREAVWHAIIRRNHGCSHLIVGRDHAGPGADSRGNPFYGPYEAQEMLAKHEDEIGVRMVDFRMMVYLPADDVYVPEDEVPTGAEVMSISGTQLRAKLAAGEEIPEWFTYASVVERLRETHPPRSRQGITLFFTGLSGSGKSAIANALLVKLLERGGRRVTLLDGDLVRKHLSSELGFSKEHRDLNIQRIGYVAAEITKNGGVAICAPIAPYDQTRKKVRRMVEEGGGFVLIHLATPLEVCETRDRKGLYAKARAGLVKEFTGISDPYEEPDDAELVIDTSQGSPNEAADLIIAYLEQEGYLSPEGG